MIAGQLRKSAASGRRATRPADVPVRGDGEFGRLLTEAGLVDVAVEAVEFSLELESSDELWTGLVDGTVRVRPLILGQPPEMQRAIRTHFDELVEEYRTDEGFEVPAAVKLASGVKPD